MTSGAEPEDIEEAAAFLARVASPSHQVVGETDDFIGILERIVNRPNVVGGVVNDAHIAAVCIAHGVDALLTRDRDFSLFPKLVTRDPFE